jgi:hypothetical protein
MSVREEMVKNMGSKVRQPEFQFQLHACATLGKLLLSLCLSFLIYIMGSKTVPTV